MVEKIKNAIKPFYKDECTVFETRVKTGQRTEFEKEIKYSSVPCRISAKSYLFGENAGKRQKNLLEAEKRVKLFCPPEYEISPGSRIEVFSMGRKILFGRSGQMHHYRTHNEVMIEILKDYA